MHWLYKTHTPLSLHKFGTTATEQLVESESKVPKKNTVRVRRMKSLKHEAEFLTPLNEETDYNEDTVKYITS